MKPKSVQEPKYFLTPYAAHRRRSTICPGHVYDIPVEPKLFCRLYKNSNSTWQYCDKRNHSSDLQVKFKQCGSAHNSNPALRNGRFKIFVEASNSPAEIPIQSVLYTDAVEQCHRLLFRADYFICFAEAVYVLVHYSLQVHVSNRESSALKQATLEAHHHPCFWILSKILALYNSPEQLRSKTRLAGELWAYLQQLLLSERTKHF